MLGAKLGTGGLLGTVAENLSRGLGDTVGVSKRGLKKVGLSGVVNPGMKRTKVIGPRSGNSTAANLVTGRGANRRFITNENYAKIHEMRGRAIIGGGAAAGAMGFVNRDAGKKGYYNPPRIQTPQGSGRFA